MVLHLNYKTTHSSSVIQRGNSLLRRVHPQILTNSHQEFILKKVAILLFITSLVLMTSVSFSQSKVNTNTLVQYGDKMYKINDDKPYTGKVFDLHKSNGNKKMEGYYKDGLRYRRRYFEWANGRSNCWNHWRTKSWSRWWCNSWLLKFLNKEK